MFPVTITLHDQVQLNAVLAALSSGAAPAPKPAAAEKAAPGKTTAKAAAAPTKTDAAPTPTAQSAEAAPQASTAATTEGNVTPAATETASPTASPAPSQDSTESHEAVDFETLKKAFLKLSTADGGRAKCEAVLKPFALGKLSEAKPEQYGAIFDLIKKASV